MGEPADSSSSSSEETISAYFVFFSTLLAVTLVLSKTLHSHPRVASILPEAGMILLVGMAAGFLVRTLYGEERLGQVRGIEEDNDDDAGDNNVDYQQLAQNLLSFSPNAFFVALLPPIIFNSGYHLRRELFFRHIVPIALLAIVGTLTSTLVIAFLLKFLAFLPGLIAYDNFQPTFTELLTFGALISATDPVSTLAVFQVKRVDPQLFYLVFGESVLNDAVGLVLFETFCKFVMRDNGAGKIAMGFVEFILGFAMDSVASPLLGWISAVLAALLFKQLDFTQAGSNKLLELSLYLLIMYVPFLMAEILQLSGIVTILVTGIAARHYVEPNLSESTQEVADVIFRLAAHLAETSIFLELGLSVVGVTEFILWRFIFWSLFACLLGRACHVYPIAALFNQSLQQEKPWNIFGYNLRTFREGMDGLMRIDGFLGGGKTNTSETNSSNTDTETASSSGSTNNNKRKAPKKSHGNVELTEHLNDFSNHHPLEQSESKDSNASTSSQQQQRDQQQQQQQPPTTSSPRELQLSHSEATLTPTPKRDMKIQAKTAHMVWFSGLRGAVAYACVRSFPDTFQHQREFMSTTMMIVLITVFVMGGATEFVLDFLNIEMNVNEDQYMEAWSSSEQAPTPGFWTWFDKRFVQRHVIRDYDVSSSSLPPTTSTQDASSSDVKNKHPVSATTVRRRPNEPRISDTVSHPDIEITESNHYDTLHEMGIPVPKGRRKTSLFDYGLNKAD
jgi:NhaP-type Na+/H+ or K+/H+ antiporter